MEWLLHALIGCMTTTLAYHAAARNIAIESIESHDRRRHRSQGFLGLSNKVRNGYGNIRVAMRVARASPSVLKEIVKRSPVFDVVAKSVPVDVGDRPKLNPHPVSRTAKTFS